MLTPEFRKPIALSLRLDDWKAVRREAARRRVPITALCREWLEPALERLRREPPSAVTDDNPDQP
jgi:hypothetical protein